MNLLSVDFYEPQNSRVSARRYFMYGRVFVRVHKGVRWRYVKKFIF